jgi:purine-binding chemotaxis protein CheW
MPEPGVDLEAASATLSFLTFRCAGRCYALSADDVVEVMRVPAVARVPQSPRALLGIANLRGSVLPVASLRGLLGFEEAAVESTARAIVLEVGARVALVVDAVDGLVSIAPEDVQVAQAELGAESGERLKGSFQTGTDGHAAKILDIAGLLAAAFAQRAISSRTVRGSTELQRAADASEGASDAQMLVTFEVAGQEFALDLQSVQEILPAPSSTTALPRAETLVVGMTALRGTLLPLLSLRALLGFPLATGVDARGKVVVMNVGGTAVGLVADQARSIVSADPDLVEPVPPVLAARLKGESQIRAIYRGDEGRRLISIIAPEHLFREDVMQRLNARGEQPVSAAAESDRSSVDERSFLVFRLGGDEFALPVEMVDEVANVPEVITRVPKTPKFLEGVVNLRGAVLPVIDQRRRFDMPKSEQGANTRRLVVVRSERHRAGLIVDGISDVMRIPAAAIEPAPDLTDGVARLVKGVINLEQSGRIVLLLDSLELLTQAERSHLDAFQAETAQAAT